MPIPESLVIYIAGALHTPQRTRPTATVGLSFETESNRDSGRCIPILSEQSQYLAELFAALEAIRSANKDSTLTIISTQSYVSEAMNKKLLNWEHEGWVGVPHRDVLRCLAAEVKARNAPTFFKVAAPGSPNRAAVLAKRATRAPKDEKWDLSLPQDTALPGLSLQGNCQKIFYRSIREGKTRKLVPRASTVKGLGKVKKSMEDTFKRHVSDADIWKAAFNKDFLPCVAQFLWKRIHNALRVGKYWSHIPECGDRAKCKDCDIEEGLEHILIKCKSPGRETIWQAAKSLWLEREPCWSEVSLGTVLGCGLAIFRDDRGKLKHGTQRLYRILISESAYLIWLLRNERVISRDGTPATEEEIKNRWKSTINQRLQVDKTLANRPTRGKHPVLAPKLVLDTWSNILDDERSLPADWLREPRVLWVAALFHKPRSGNKATESGSAVVPHCPWACETHFSGWWKPLPMGLTFQTLQTGWANQLLVATGYVLPKKKKKKKI
ncbi:hypothetical protein DFH08DRAFT_716566 [Mycena albidolilacea]|uniref:Reverse transcriptase zinc-binding domain-containing protein n=1 Tax=Mycena albidolilacea TaxID=1033008 RepID=A0AAD6ZA81_9AGAR|nr:hypothetical protein DFH08DRAFT_716566 [Mycena albidolilacea]